MKVEKYKGDAIELVRNQIKTIKTVNEVVMLDQHLIAEDYTNELIQMFTDLNKFVNVSRKMSGEQISETITMLFQEYPRLSLQEYGLFFRKIKAGQFGTLYDSLDGVKIMVFMSEFYPSVVKATNYFHEERHLELKKEVGCRDTNNYYNEYK